MNQKPSERIKEITDDLLLDNPDKSRLSCHLYAVDLYLDEQYEQEQKNRQEFKKALKE